MPQYDLIFALMGEAKHFVKASDLTKKSAKELEGQLEALQRVGVKTTRQFQDQARDLEVLMLAHQDDKTAINQLEQAQNQLIAEMAKATDSIGLQTQARTELNAVGIITTAQIQEEIIALQKLKVAAEGDDLAMAQLVERQKNLQDTIRNVTQATDLQNQVGHSTIDIWNNLGQAIEDLSFGSFKSAGQNMHVMFNRLRRLNREVPKGTSLIGLLSKAIISPGGLVIAAAAAIVVLPKLIKKIKEAGKAAKESAVDIKSIVSEMLRIDEENVEFLELQLQTAKDVQAEFDKQIRFADEMIPALTTLVKLEEKIGRELDIHFATRGRLHRWLSLNNLALKEGLIIMEVQSEEAKILSDQARDIVRHEIVRLRQAKRLQDIGLGTREIEKDRAKRSLTALEQQDKKVKELTAELVRLESGEVSRLVALEDQATVLEDQLRTLKFIELLWQKGDIQAAIAAQNASVAVGRGTLMGVGGLPQRGAFGFSESSRRAQQEIRRAAAERREASRTFFDTGGMAGEVDLVGGSNLEMQQMADQADRLQDHLDQQADRWASYGDTVAELMDARADDHKLMLEEMGLTQGEWLTETINGLRMIEQIAGTTFGGFADLFKEMAGKNQKVNKAFFAAYKLTAIAQAVADTYVAANRALATAPPPFNYILMAGVIATGLANVARIKSTSPGGGGGGGGGRGGVGGNFGNTNFSEYSQRGGGSYVPNRPAVPPNSRFVTAPASVAAVAVAALGMIQNDRGAQPRSIRLDTRRADLYLDLQEEDFIQTVRGA